MSWRSLPCLALALCAGIAAADPLPRPITDADYRPTDPAMVALGRLLFYDPILSGNRAVSCATCHHPRFATSDGLSLGLGDGGTDLGPARRPDPTNPPEQRIPRNAPALFNLGAREFTVLFHDGRIEADPDKPGGLRTPLAGDMTDGFDSLLSAQTMFPVLSPDEMAGHYGENEISRAVRQGLLTGEGGAWALISGRVAAIPAYADGFAAALPDIAAGRPIAFTDISNAIAAFIELEWRSDDSPFDAHLRGARALAGPALEGMRLFYGEAGCARCHAGPFQTDHGFHATGQPQIGPGKAARFERHARDEGRFRVTGDPADLHAFRTPSLRNVSETGPWGHAGAYGDLRAFLGAHAAGAAALDTYDASGALLPDLPGIDDFRIMADDAERAAIAAAAEPVAPGLDSARIDALMAFLGALSDPVALSGRLRIPDAVPSGLPVER